MWMQPENPGLNPCYLSFRKTRMPLWSSRKPAESHPQSSRKPAEPHPQSSRKPAKRAIRDPHSCHSGQCEELIRNPGGGLVTAAWMGVVSGFRLVLPRLAPGRLAGMTGESFILHSISVFFCVIPWPYHPESREKIGAVAYDDAAFHLPASSFLNGVHT